MNPLPLMVPNSVRVWDVIWMFAVTGGSGGA